MNSHLLLVEDHESYGATLVQGLQRQHFSVRWVRSLREARLELEDGRFQLALLDVGLPDGSGMDLCVEIRSRHPDMATVFLTSMSDPSHRLQGLQAGADDYVPKTSHFREIVLRLENALARRRHWQSVSSCVSMGRRCIDFAAQEVRVGRRTYRLGAREAALLRFLLARRGGVVSRDEILDEVWSPDEYPSPRTVDNFIVKLRRILEEDPQNPLILRSVWGVGYQLDASAAA
jgi:two-component system alkaline phosphatase synthesis response regulator PhoP